MSAVTFHANLYDGKSAARKQVEVSASSDGGLTFHVEGEASPRRISSADYQWELPVGKGPQRFRLKDGSLLEAKYNEQLQALMLQRGPSRLQRLSRAEGSLKYVLGLFCGAGVVVFCLYIYGVPLAATLLRPLVPHSVKETVGAQGIQALDNLLFEPSKISQTRQDDLRHMALQLAEDAELPFTIEVHFRRWGDIPNALALPPHHVVLTDGLIKLLSEEEIEAVLGHELGHLAHDHVTHKVIRGSIVSGLAFALLGGDPGVLGSLAVGLVDASYSQHHESEADLYGVELMKRLGKQPALLADALEKMLEGEDESELAGYFTSHPLTSERTERIRQAATEELTQ